MRTPKVLNNFVFLSVLLTGFALLMGAGCSPGPAPGKVRVALSLPPVSIERVAITSSAADIVPVTVDIVRTNGVWGGFITNIPAGTNRSFLAEAYDGLGHTALPRPSLGRDHPGRPDDGPRPHAAGGRFSPGVRSTRRPSSIPSSPAPRPSRPAAPSNSPPPRTIPIRATPSAPHGPAGPVPSRTRPSSGPPGPRRPPLASPPSP